MLGDTAFDARRHLVLDADVGEGAAHHDFVVAAAGAVAVEVGAGDIMVHEIFPGRAVELDRAGGADVVGGDAVREDGEGAGVDDRSEEHTSELQSLMRMSYAVF